jgi:programmed cell death 8 (apoptosis-inducing factor)
VTLLDAYEIVKLQNLQALAKPSEKVRFLGGVKVKSLDPETSVLTLDNGQLIEYKQILLATGGTPKKLPIVKTLPEEAQKRILTFRSVSCFAHLGVATLISNE